MSYFVLSWQIVIEQFERGGGGGGGEEGGRGRSMHECSLCGKEAPDVSSLARSPGEWLYKGRAAVVFLSFLGDGARQAAGLANN